MAPRFINLPDWLKVKSTDPKAALQAYKPIPTTWVMWEKAAKIIDEKAAKNFEQNKIPELNLLWLKDVHAIALDQLLDSAGEFRNQTEMGMAIYRRKSLTRKQAENIKYNEYRGIESDKKIVNFVPVQCFEDRTPEFQQEWKDFFKANRIFLTTMWPEIDTNQYFKGDDGIERQCGYFTYAPPEEVFPQLDSWLNYINTATLGWGSSLAGSDPIFVAAKAQRWFISIHPFEKGNGRVSRYLMEWLLQSIGLPTPIIKDMDEDLYLNEQDWAKEVGNGLLRVVEEAEKCIVDQNSAGCQEIALSIE